MVEKFNKYSKINESIFANDLETNIKFHEKLKSRLDDFFDRDTMFDITLMIENDEMDIPLSPENYELLEEFIFDLIKSDADYSKEKYDKIKSKNKLKKDFNI